MPTDDVAEVVPRFGASGGEGDIPWWRYRLALSGVGVVVTAGVWLGVPPFSALPGPRG